MNTGKERPLTRADIAQAQRLATEADWNQLPADWELMLQLGHGYGIDDDRGNLVATALTLPLGERISWISMVLVAGRARRGGLGSRLLQRCLEEVQASGRVAGLDASELGRPMYLGLGFRDVYRVNRWQLGPHHPSPSTPPPGVSLAALTDGGSLKEAIAWDREVTGLDRAAILRDLQRRLPECARVAYRDGWLAGFLLARPGRRATQFGPLVATDPAVAKSLLTSALEDAGSTPVFLDVPESQTAFTEPLRGMGTIQREFTRMLFESDQPFGRAEQIYAIAGPELG